MKNYSFKLKASITDKGYPILLSLRAYKGHRIVRKFYNTDVFVMRITDWDKKKCKVIGGQGQDEKNTKLKYLANLYESEILKYTINNPGRNLPIDILVELIRPDSKSKGSGLLVDFWGEYINELLEQERYNTASQFKIGLASLKNCVNVTPRIRFEDISSSLIEEWHQVMLKDGLMPNSRSYNIRAARTVFKQAIARNLMSADNYPFGKKNEHDKFCISEHTKTTTAKRFLPTNFLETVCHYTSEENHKMWAVKLWLFSFYCRGMNFRDMATLENSCIKKIMGADGKERDFIIYQRAKTGKMFEIPYSPKLKQLVQELKQLQRVRGDYLLPIIKVVRFNSKNDLIKHINSQRKLMNSRLHDVADECNFPDSIKAFTTYTSRHTYAQFLYNQNAPLPVISEALGHADLDTTRVYFSDSGNKRLEKWDNLVQGI